MYRSPWLAVAVYALAPVALAPIATDIAANSDSTLTNSQRSSRPDFTSADSPSTMCVWGLIGYAQITSGRHSATVSATASDPSICLSMGWLSQLAYGRSGLRPHHSERLLRRSDVLLAEEAGEPLSDRTRNGAERHSPGQRGEPPEQRRVRKRLAELLARELGPGNGLEPAAVEALEQLLDPQLTKALRCVDQNPAVRLQAAEHVHLVKQRRVDHDQGVGRGDRLAGTNRTLVDPAKRHDRRPRPLRSETGERLRVPFLGERGDRQQLCGGDDTLAAAPVDPDLKHAATGTRRRWEAGSRRPLRHVSPQASTPATSSV